MRRKGRRLCRTDLSNRRAWPTEHPARLREAIDEELHERECGEPEAFERGLAEALARYRASRAA